MNLISIRYRQGIDDIAELYRVVSSWDEEDRIEQMPFVLRRVKNIQDQFAAAVESNENCSGLLYHSTFIGNNQVRKLKKDFKFCPSIKEGIEKIQEIVLPLCFRVVNCNLTSKFRALRNIARMSSSAIRGAVESYQCNRVNAHGIVLTVELIEGQLGKIKKVMADTSRMCEGMAEDVKSLKKPAVLIPQGHLDETLSLITMLFGEYAKISSSMAYFEEENLAIINLPSFASLLKTDVTQVLSGVSKTYDIPLRFSSDHWMVKSLELRSDIEVQILKTAFQIYEQTVADFRNSMNSFVSNTDTYSQYMHITTPLDQLQTAISSLKEAN